VAVGTNIKTYFEGAWHDGNVPIMRAADHGAWQGTTVFDGARYVDGVAPDLLRHCERVVASARALMLQPRQTPQEIHDIIWEGLRRYPEDAAVYVRPDVLGHRRRRIRHHPAETPAGFCVCLEEVAIAPPEAAVAPHHDAVPPPRPDRRRLQRQGRLPLSQQRPHAGRGACDKGYDNALVADALGNVAEAGSANVFMVRDGTVFTPIPNGTFLNGITRQRHMTNLRAAGVEVVETVLTFDDFRKADEVFMTGNLNKVTPVVEFDGTNYQRGPVDGKGARSLLGLGRSDAG
jgi:branched-chain amino acid aminotransferase